MEVGKSPRQSVVVNARMLVAKPNRPKIVFPLSSAGFCVIHWLAVHNFSSHVFLGALVFGAIAAVAVAWLSDFVHEEMNEVSSLLQDPLIRPAIDATV